STTTTAFRTDIHLPSGVSMELQVARLRATCQSSPLECLACWYISPKHAAITRVRIPVMITNMPNRLAQVLSLKASASPRAFQCVGKGSGMLSQFRYTASNASTPVARVSHTHFHGGF